MDPITALGAASSAVGIAAFALDLAVGLFKLSSQVRSATESLHGVGEAVNATAFALEEIEKLLLKEEDNVRRGKALTIFSIAGLTRIKETANRCLIVLWKIEAVVCGEEPDEQELDARLISRASTASARTLSLHPNFTKSTLGLWDRLVFAISTSDKLKGYGQQLQSFQISLSLIFDVVTVAYLLSKSSLTDDDLDKIATAKQDLRQSRPEYRRVAHNLLNNQKAKASHRYEDRRLKRPFAATHGPKRNMVQRDMPVPDGVGAMTRYSNVFMMAHLVPDDPQASPAQASSMTDYQSEDSATLTAQEASGRDFDSGTAADSHNGSDYGVGYMTEASESSCSSNMGDAAGPVKVYTFQKRGEWREEKLAFAEISQRLEALDRDPMTALDKKLSLSMEHQGRVDAILTKVNDEEETQLREHQWNLRQLELKKGRLSRLRGLQAIIVYLQKEAQNRQDRRPYRKRRARPASARKDDKRARANYVALRDRDRYDSRRGRMISTDEPVSQSAIFEGPGDEWTAGSEASIFDSGLTGGVHCMVQPQDISQLDEYTARHIQDLEPLPPNEQEMTEAESQPQPDEDDAAQLRRSFTSPCDPIALGLLPYTPTFDFAAPADDQQHSQMMSNTWSAPPTPILSRSHQYPSTNGTNSAAMHPDEDWTKVTDPVERKRIKDRIAKRNYRKKIKERMQFLESKAGEDNGKASKNSHKSNGTKKSQQAQHQRRRSSPPVSNDSASLAAPIALHLPYTSPVDPEDQPLSASPRLPGSRPRTFSAYQESYSLPSDQLRAESRRSHTEPGFSQSLPRSRLLESTLDDETIKQLMHLLTPAKDISLCPQLDYPLNPLSEPASNLAPVPILPTYLGR